MMENLSTMLWKEWKEYMVRGNSKIDNFLLLVGFPVFLVLFFGVYFPWSTGSILLGSIFSLMTYMLFPIVFVTGLVMESFIGERREHTLETLLASCIPDNAIVLGKVVAAFGYVSIPLAISFVIGLAIIAISRGVSSIFNTMMTLELGIFIISILACLLSAFISALASLKAKTMIDAQIFFIAIVFALVVATIIAPLVVLSLIPAEWKNWVINTVSINVFNILIISIAVIMAFNLVFYMVAIRSFKRTRMVDT